MKQFLFIISLLIAFVSHGQAKGKAVVKKKRQEKYYLTRTCYDFLEWDGIVLGNKAAEQRINNAITAAVRRYRLSKYDARARCSGEMDYEPEFRIVYARHNVLSYMLTAYTYFKGGAHGGRQFENLNFSTATGRQINFHELVDRSKIPAADSFIIRKLVARLAEGGTTDPDLNHYREQLPNLFFEFSDTGININFTGESYATSVVGFALTWAELKPYADPKGLLRPFYPGK